MEPTTPELPATTAQLPSFTTEEYQATTTVQLPPFTTASDDKPTEEPEPDPTQKTEEPEVLPAWGVALIVLFSVAILAVILALIIRQVYRYR